MVDGYASGGLLGRTSDWITDKTGIETPGLDRKIQTPGLEKVKAAGMTALDFIPIIGDVKAAKEVWDEMQKPEPNWPLIGALGGAALIGLVPGLGDIAAKGIRAGAKAGLKAVEGGVDVIKRLDIDPNTVGSLGGNIKLKPNVVKAHDA